MKIFVVEDDKSLVKMMENQLSRYAYQTFVPENFAAVLDEFLMIQPDLVLLDVNLPYYDGFYWCQKIRERSLVPILFISARDGNMDQVMALEYGADDYLVKPFSYDLLLAKVKSHIRRVYGDYSQSDRARSLKAGELIYYPEALKMVYRESSEWLTVREGELLTLLMSAHPEMVKRERILNLLWDDERFVDDNTLSVNVGRLRKKLAAMGINDPIQTIRGKGYALSVIGTEE
ncbi:response regulator transcription factor [Enterococcus casseliflavus]|uniref:Response regulator n=1 Tax=Enterococcus casseliflavus TaxID=37734 RepID=A0ABD6Z114_ENTCA|nr:response regulator transcription factor [Enterococcus casseliflavus]MBE9880748.1 response regulator transcription factor [Enterococcus casseliflavus]MBO6386687.1 response regulator transcription factor [Enterococcus casseliflavus]MCD5161494.1 response regulator transcription factor [Enterococcus casseliflavus]QGN29256.1 response regulator [Enterococcus casseliflavus]